MIGKYLQMLFSNLVKSTNVQLIFSSATVIVCLLDLYLNKEEQVLEFVNLSKVLAIIKPFLLM